MNKPPTKRVVFLYLKLNTMDIDFMPFKLGMEYDNWEFDLESDYETTESEIPIC